MPLAPGVRLGPYEILAPLGRGGMGEVWKALDPRLGRQVAIKVLPDSLTRDPTASARFEREARAVAALSHPNILALYDIGATGELAYVVTELLEGQNLRSRLLLGRPGSRDATAIARQIADGLAAAHERGIVHRDLKPENVWLLPDGRVKILDFGLAKPAAVDAGGDLIDRPTLELAEGPATSEGTILGSVGYMSPEQIRGRPLDARSDLFSLGVVLWEMVTGERPFRGDTAVDTLMAVLQAEPPEIDPAIGVPAALARILERCLKKDPGQRFQTARDLAFALGEIATASRSTSSTSTTWRASSRWPRRLAAALAVTALGAAGILGAVRLRKPPGVASFQRATFTQGAVRTARFTGDGRTILYSARFDGEEPGLYLTRSGSHEARRLEVGERELLAVSSRDELALMTAIEEAPELHVRSGRLETVGLAGGDALAIAENVVAADWFPDGSKLAIVRHVGDQFRVEAPPGQVVASGSERWANVRVSPDGRSLAAFRFAAPSGSEAALVRIDLATKGQQTLVDRIVTLGGLCWSPSGEAIWYSTFGHEAGDLHAVDLSGRTRVLLDTPDDFEIQDLSPDGEVLALNGSVRTVVLKHDRPDAPPVRLTRYRWGWVSSMSRDGRSIVIVEDPVSSEEWPFQVLHRSDAPPQRITKERGTVAQISLDGKLLLSETMEGGAAVLEIRTLDGATLRRFDASAEFGAFPGAVGVFPLALLSDSVLGLRGTRDGPPRLVRRRIDGGDWAEIAAVEVFEFPSFFVDPTESSVLYRAGLRDYRILHLTPGSAPVEVRGLGTGERIWGWHADGGSVWVGTTAAEPIAFERLELATGRRDSRHSFIVPGATLENVGDLRVSEDGTVAAATAQEVRNALFVVRGVR